MKSLKGKVLAFLKSEEGATTRTIALIVALIFVTVIVVIVAISKLGTTVSGTFSAPPDKVKIDKPR